MAAARMLLLSTADTELLAARASGAGWRTANPARIDPADLPALLADIDLAVVRLLGGVRNWEAGVRAVLTSGVPTIALGGEAAPDAELMALSTVPTGAVGEALAYLREGGVANLRQLHAFLSDTVLLTGEGFDPPEAMPEYGVHARAVAADPAPALPGFGDAVADPTARHSAPALPGFGDAVADPTARHSAPALPGGPTPQPDSHRHAVGDQAAPGDVDNSSAPGGRWGQPSVRNDHGVEPAPGQPVVAVVFYRAHELSGNTAFVDALCDAIEERGGRALPVFCGSLRGLREPVAAGDEDPEPQGPTDTGLWDLLRGADAIIATVLASGGTTASRATAGGEEEAWDVGALAALDVPVIQGLCLTGGREAWAASDAAISPVDAAMQVAIPEFDGRLVSVPFSFKAYPPDTGGVPVYVADPERARRVAGIAVRHARLRSTPPESRRLAIVLSSYPTKHARVGNAVGLDTPASAVRLLRALAAEGYDLGPDDSLWRPLPTVSTNAGTFPDGCGFAPLIAVQSHIHPESSAPAATQSDIPAEGDALIHALIAAGGHDVEWLTEDQLRAAPARVPSAAYRRWFDALAPELRERIRGHWGDPPGALYVDGDGPDAAIVLAALTFGNVVLMIQPPRGFGENPVAIYHDPDLPPSHHYLAAYRWLDAPVDAGGFGADAVVHLGKHGTLEWLPGKGLGLSAACSPDAVLGDLPLVYPFIVNDPGEGTQAKRRAHATVVDHLVPPMARAETYGDLAKLEQLLDEHATVAALDPAKLPALRAQIWTLIQAAQLQHDLHRTDMPAADEFDDFLLHVDGYLCEVKDVQIRDGLHVLGQAPSGEARVNLVLAILRATQVWGGTAGALPGLRAAIAAHYGLDEKALLAAPGEVVAVPPALTAAADGPSHTGADAVDLIERLARGLVAAMDARSWDADAASAVCVEMMGDHIPDVERVLRFAATEVVPRLERTTDEIGHVLHALGGGYVPAGPSGSPTRGLVSTLPTGRNFYSVDPKAIPSRGAWDVGQALADSLIARHLAETGTYPRSVGLTVWGTSAMRTQGDDIAEILALLGCRPTWDDVSRRVTGFEIVPSAELGRPRIDVTVRISGFFRDAFPHVVALLDDAVRAVADLDEDAAANHVRAHVAEDLAAHGDRRRATTRIFGSKPGAYGAGLLPLIDARTWRDDADLAEVYAVWGGYAYGRELDGREARADMESAFRRMAVAAKNQDTREHDIVDSDDYFQYHGGMVATVRALTGTSPAAYVGDSAVPEQVRTRTLAEETHRVFRARVVNPRWIAAMRRHGYKGAFELAATVDYLFGYDATAGVVDDWMYEQLASSYVFDPELREFFQRSNPWALRGIAERLLEAADRGMWAKPDAATIAGLQQAYLDLESDLEGGDE